MLSAAALRLPVLRLPALTFRQWMASLVLVAVLALNLIAGISILGFGAPDSHAKVAKGMPAATRAVAPPAPEPLRFQNVAPQDAVAINAAVPIADLPNPPARPFVLSASSLIDRERAINCLTSAIYYEAATEPLDGQRAVAQVVLNRVRHPAYPNSVCGVVYQGMERSTGCQFTFTCDGSLARTPMASYWKRARQIAEAALTGSVYKPVGWATHYHTNWVVPYWSSSLVKAAIVGTHIFYRWTGGWGTGPAFRNRYAGVEPDVNRLRASALAAAAAAAAAAATTATGDAVLLDAVAAEQAAAIAAGKPLAPTSLDSFQRAVLRRYEPAKAEGVAGVLAKQTRSGDAVAVSHRWALTGGDANANKDPGFGKKAEAEAAKPAPPKELEGVRKVGDTAAAAAGAGSGLTE
jgi:spore germination cell wall hydrolase CwlJ-like protein